MGFLWDFVSRYSCTVSWPVSASAENRGQRVQSQVHMWKIRRNQSTTGPVTFIYLPVSRDDAQCAMKSTRRAPRSLGIATVADDFSSGIARSVTRIQLGASQRSWHGALFRLGETRFEEGRENGRARHRRLNLKYLERYVSPCGGRPWSMGFIRKNSLPVLR